MTQKQELQALTGIRFYAALVVFLSHGPLIPGMEQMAGDKLVFNAGVVGVSCFFVLSGFILTYNYETAFRSGVGAGSYFRFVWDRWTKIYPVHFLMLLVAIPLQVKSPNLPLDWRAVPFHAVLAQCLWPVTKPTYYQYLNVPSWSISCEWFFYLLAPLSIYIVLNRRRQWLPVVLIGMYSIFLGFILSQKRSEFDRLYLVSWFAPSRFPEFLAGIFLARLFLEDRGRRLARYSTPLQVAGLALIVSGAMYRAHAPWPLWGGLLYLPGAVLLILGLAYGEGPLAAHLSSRTARRLGMASFCLYLMQAPMMRGMKGIWMLQGWSIHSWFGFWTMMAAMFLLVQASALVMHDKYEIKVQKRLRTWFRQTTRGSAVGCAHGRLTLGAK